MRKSILFLTIFIVLSCSKAGVFGDTFGAMESIFQEHPNFSLGIGLGIVIMALTKFSFKKQKEGNANILAVSAGVATFLLVMFALPQEMALKYSNGD